MYKLFIIFIIAISVSETYAKEVKTHNEAGVIFSSLNSFGGTYRVGSETLLMRINLLGLGFSTNENADSKTENSNLDFSIGAEYRKKLNEKIYARFGLDLNYGFRSSNYILDTEDDYREIDRTTNTVGGNLVFGLNYSVNDFLVLGFEILPGVNYQLDDSVDFRDDIETREDVSGFNVGLNTGVAQLSLVFSF